MTQIKTSLFAGILFAGTLFGCGGSPTEADCDKFADKMAELTVKQVAEEGKSDDPAADAMGEAAATIAAEASKPELKKVCMEEGTKAEVECVLKATSMGQVEKDCG